MEPLQNPISLRIQNFELTRNILRSHKLSGNGVIRRLKYKSINAPNLWATYAGFGSRAIATLIDMTIVFGLIFALEKFMVAINLIAIDSFAYFSGIAIVAWVLYNSVLESSVYQATLGKMMLNIKVIDLYGNRVSFLRALVRCISVIFSLLPFGLGVWYMTTDPKKQAWHDLISGTYVTKT